MGQGIARWGRAEQAGQGRAGQGRAAVYLKMKRMAVPASLLPREGKLMSSTLRPTCLATAFAIIVLPTPLAPWKSRTRPPAPPTAPQHTTFTVSTVDPQCGNDCYRSCCKTL